MSDDEPAGARLIRCCQQLDGQVSTPPSKSLTIRALAAAALASGRSVIDHPLFADDTRLMADALQKLGIAVTRHETSFVVEGAGGIIPANGNQLWLDNAGTPLRLLTALCTLGKGRFVLDGSARMRERPSRHLVTALRDLGVSIRSIHDDGCPPIEIQAAGFPGGHTILQAGASSQYLSALLMVAPCGRQPLEIEIAGDIVSRPYVDLTLQVMQAFGARVEHDGYRRFLVHPTGYRSRDFTIEGDASSASYFFAAAAITDGCVRVTGIPPGSLQGDLAFLDLLERMGCCVTRETTFITLQGSGSLRGIEADLGDTPDLVPTLASVALFADGTTTIDRIGHLRLKETDRIETVAACVRQLGGLATTKPDSLIIHPPATGRQGLKAAIIDPAGDHRLAMAFAVAGLALPGMRLLNPDCVAKSFPDFFKRMDALISQG